MSRGLTTVDVSYRATDVSLDCGSSPLTVGHTRGCTASVTDVAPGSASTPTGMIAFSSEASDRFINNDCWLSTSGTAPNCSVVFTPTAVGSGSRTITATYLPNRIGAAGRKPDLVHGSSAATVVLTVLHSTSTTLTCADSDLTVGQSTTCVATVTDTSPDQTSTPTGSMAFVGQVGDTFSGPCDLAGSGATASCQVTYTAGPGAGAHILTARYSGDSTHHPSNGRTTIGVARP